MSHAIQLGRNRVGDVLKTVARRKEGFMEVKIEDIKVTIKLKIAPRKKSN